jgi:hypothetical protein
MRSWQVGINCPRPRLLIGGSFAGEGGHRTLPKESYSEGSALTRNWPVPSALLPGDHPSKRIPNPKATGCFHASRAQCLATLDGESCRGHNAHEFQYEVSHATRIPLHHGWHALARRMRG